MEASDLTAGLSRTTDYGACYFVSDGARSLEIYVHGKLPGEDAERLAKLAFIRKLEVGHADAGA